MFIRNFFRKLEWPLLYTHCCPPLVILMLQSCVRRSDPNRLLSASVARVGDARLNTWFVVLELSGKVQDRSGKPPCTDLLYIVPLGAVHEGRAEGELVQGDLPTGAEQARVKSM